MGMREKIAEALVNVQACSDTGQVLPAERYADAVMEVVEEEIRAAYTRGHSDALEQAARVWEDGSPEDDDYATAIRDLPLTHDNKEC